MHPRRLTGSGSIAVALAIGILATPVAYAQEGLRPAVGLPLAKAKALMAQHNYAAAQAQVAIAARQKAVSANESFVIDEMRGAIAQASGDTATASRVFQGLINSGRIGGAQLTQMLLAETSLSYQSKDYPGTISWAQRYAKAGGKDPSVRTLIIQSYYLQHDYANAARTQQVQIDDQVRARRTPPEDQLQLLAACQKQIADSAGLQATMTQLVTYYPKQSYWADLVYALQTRPGFSDRLELDVDRFKAHVGSPFTEGDYMQMTQLALGDNDPAAAATVIEHANAQHVFGQPAQAGREQRLTALVDKTVADNRAKLDSTLAAYRAAPATTSQQIYDLGQQYVSFKQYEKGIGLMREGIGRGDLRRSALAQLRIGEALVDAGNAGAAAGAFQAVPATTDGTSDLAKLWLLSLRAKA